MYFGQVFARNHESIHDTSCYVPLSPGDIAPSSDKYLDGNGAGVVIFTSRTTGPPKGAVMMRAYLHDTSGAVADHFGVTENDVIVHVLPRRFDMGWSRERWKKGRLHIFSGVPTIYMRVMWYFEQKIAGMEPHETDQYLVGTRQFRALLCATSALPTSGQEFWTKILDGKTILSRYGATEIGPVFTPSIDSDSDPPGSVGPVLTITLSEGHQGEVLIKGDDLSVLADDEFSRRVAAVVGLKIEQTTYKCPGNGWVGKYFTLDDLRADRRRKLAGYKIPTLLRVVVHEILKTGIGKVVKGVLGPKFFPVDYEQHPDVQIWSPVKRSVPDPR
ncbi:AMP dependent synthetase and ligase [Histoplasma capsulatum H143]|uniref:AMP dependent synthetase and ligase n=1 Tax=Ajellomyces capsulatus (strain H143) TaxID=544712 RepID=C6HH37_AJECH|nr:AMP dependent synthetase and ligase [Histoplasma capsulatum H143]